jgi:hypothetical protein
MSRMHSAHAVSRTMKPPPNRALCLQFDNFHGGSDSRYSPTSDHYMYFDDLKIRAGLCLDPGLDSFTLAASQYPITQLGDSFTGFYKRDVIAS